MICFVFHSFPYTVRNFAGVKPVNNHIMKPSRFLTFIIGVVMCSFSMIAEAANENGTVTNGTSIILRPDLGNNPTTRPKIPSPQSVECMYDSGVLTIDFVIPEGVCNITISDLTSGHVTRQTIDSSDLTVHVVTGPLSESIVEIITEKGNTYCGVLTSE